MFAWLSSIPALGKIAELFMVVIRMFKKSPQQKADAAAQEVKDEIANQIDAANNRDK